MRIIVDDQLPVALARWIAAQGVDGKHVSDVGLSGHPDLEIWNFAKRETFVIVSMDSDFHDLSLQDADGPPVVWLRWGNMRKPALLIKFAGDWPGIRAKIEDGLKLIVRPSLSHPPN